MHFQNLGSFFLYKNVLLESCLFWGEFKIALQLKRIGVDLAGILGDAWQAPKVGWC